MLPEVKGPPFNLLPSLSHLVELVLGHVLLVFALGVVQVSVELLALVYVGYLGLTDIVQVELLYVLIPVEVVLECVPLLPLVLLHIFVYFFQSQLYLFLFILFSCFLGSHVLEMFLVRL